jgi:hypothetical protein
MASFAFGNMPALMHATQRLDGTGIMRVGSNKLRAMDCAQSIAFLPHRRDRNHS